MCNESCTENYINTCQFSISLETFDLFNINNDCNCVQVKKVGFFTFKRVISQWSSTPRANIVVKSRQAEALDTWPL